MKFYLFGLQRTGTNLVQNLLEKNYGATIVNKGSKQWKHVLSPPNDLDPDIPVLRVIKSPYTWVDSIVYRERADFYEKHDYAFFTGGPVMVKDVNLNCLIHVYKSYYEKWNGIGTLIRYEDILYANQQKEYFGKMFGEVEDWYSPAEGSMFMCESFKDKAKPYYESQKSRRLTPVQQKVINKMLTQQWFESTGYIMHKVAGVS